MKYGELNLGQIEAIVNKLGGMDGALRFLSGETAVKTEDFFHEADEFTVRIPALPRPTLKALQAKFSWVKSIERDTSPETAVTLRLGTILRPDEDRVNGTEYELRLVSVTGPLGYQQAEWLVAHQDAFPGLTALLGKVYIDFPGLVVVRAFGCRFFPYLFRVGGRWDLRWPRVEDGFDRRGRVALSGR